MDGDDALRDALLAALDAAAIGTLTAAFAHAANNRLTVLLSCLDMLEESRSVAGDDARGTIRLALDATQQLVRDFGALLAGARRSEPGREAVDVDAAVERARRVFEAIADHAVPVLIEPAPALAVHVERARFELCLVHLFVLGQRRGATAITVTVATNPSTPPAGRAGHCELRFRFADATLPDALLEPPAEHGNSLGRLQEPDGLEFASVETFATAMRGQARAWLEGPRQAVVQLRLPRGEPSRH